MKRSGSAGRAVAMVLLLGAVALSTAAQSPLRLELKSLFVYSDSGADSVQSWLGRRSQYDEDLSLRLSYGRDFGPFDIEAHYLLLAGHGESVALQPRLDGLFLRAGAPAPAGPWWDLRRTVRKSGETLLSHGFDRLYVGYSGEKLVLRVGRQSLTWGTGLVFHPMDLFNPFPPNALDAEYKPGIDMVYGQWLFADGGDVQGLIVPRRSPQNGELEGAQGSFGFKWRYPGAAVQMDLMGAKHYGDRILGVDLSGPAGGATWSAGAVSTWLRGGGRRVSLLANLRGAGRLFGRDSSFYVEAYRNGFGAETTSATLNSLPPPLLSRLARGELFNTGRDYLAAGADVQWTPLITLSPLLIANLDDRSLLTEVNLHVSLSDNLLLDVGVQEPVGGRGTEFGGLPLSPSLPAADGPARRLFFELRAYF